jgi:hypothetical protein
MATAVNGLLGVRSQWLSVDKTIIFLTCDINYVLLKKYNKAIVCSKRANFSCFAYICWFYLSPWHYMLCRNHRVLIWLMWPKWNSVEYYLRYFNFCVFDILPPRGTTGENKSNPSLNSDFFTLFSYTFK